MEQRGAKLLAFADILPRASDPEHDLVWEVARNLTSALVQGRGRLTLVADAARGRLREGVGMLIDAGGDVAAYVDPARWLEGIFDTLGIATRDTIDQLDDRIDRVELRIDDVARQRAREELMLLQQRLGELEELLSQARPVAEEQTRSAMSELLGRLAHLETRIDAMPWHKLEA